MDVRKTLALSSRTRDFTHTDFSGKPIESLISLAYNVNNEGSLERGAGYVFGTGGLSRAAEGWFMSAPKQRILLVDDHSVLREGLRAIIATTEDLEVCGEAENPEQALDAVVELKPDLAVIDISLTNKIDGIELTRRIKEQFPELPVLVLSMHEAQRYMANAMAAGASGYLTKTEGAAHFLAAVRQILGGKKSLSETLP